MLELRHVVILGSRGFIGRNLAASLRAQGVAVDGLGSSDLDLRRPNAFESLDGLVTRDTTLVLASCVTPDRGTDLDALEENLAIVLNTARWLQRHPVGRFVYLSSDAVYPWSDQAVTEDARVEPSTPYALAKIVGESAFGLAHEHAGFPLLICRITGVYGPGDSHGSYGPSRFIRAIAKRESVTLFGQGEEKRDHVYIADVARVLGALIARGSTGVFNVASGTSRSFADVLALLARLSAIPVTVTNLPRESPITHRHFEIGKLAREIGPWSPTPLEAGLKETLGACAK